jgi:hypothetical protein
MVTCMYCSIELMTLQISSQYIDSIHAALTARRNGQLLPPNVLAPSHCLNPRNPDLTAALAFLLINLASFPQYSPFHRRNELLYQLPSIVNIFLPLMGLELVLCIRFVWVLVALRTVKV